MTVKSKFILMLIVGLIAINLAVYAGPSGETDAASSEGQAEFNAAGFPIVDEQITLKFFTSLNADTDDPDTFPVIQEIEKQKK